MNRRLILTPLSADSAPLYHARLTALRLPFYTCGVEVEDGGASTRQPADGAPWQPPKSRADRDAEARALALYREGQHARAITILMDLYATPLLAVIQRSVHDAELAKDIRQVVFLQAVSDLATFEGRGSVWGWLCGIADHRSIDAVRRARVRGADKQASAEILDQLPDPTEPGFTRDPAVLRALEHCLHKLPDALRSEVLMRYTSGLTYQEIAEAQHKPASTVQIRVSRGLAKLRDCMRRKGVER
jgi:RNA polymerase sigma-70 factor (ECF subfamily)